MAKARNRAERRKRLRERQRDQARRRNEGSGQRGVLDISQLENVKMYEMKEGKNIIDILPYIVSSDHHPNGLEKGEEDYKLDLWVHNNVGPKDISIVCPLETYGLPCPICEDRKTQIDDGMEWDSREIKKIKAKRRVFYVILDCLEPKKGLQIFHTSHFKFEKEVYSKAEYENEAFTTYADLEEGYSIKFRGVQSTYEGKKFIEAKDFEFVEREPYEESILEETFPLDSLIITHTYDEIEALYHNLQPEEEGEEEEKRQRSSTKHQRPASLRSRITTTRKTKRLKQEPEEEVAEEPEEEVEEEPEEEVAEEPEEEVEEELDVCPYRHEFGVDHTAYEDCQYCEDDTFLSCQEASLEIARARKDREQRKEKKKRVTSPTRRTLRRKQRT